VGPRAREVLRQVGLEGLEDRPALSRLSWRPAAARRVARALASKPAIVLGGRTHGQPRFPERRGVDRPDGHLNATSGTTFLIATHDSRVIAHTRRYIEMTDGRITADERRGADIAA
jgi:putative ABC transport system ATP-binding protein